MLSRKKKIIVKAAPKAPQLRVPPPPGPGPEKQARTPTSIIVKQEGGSGSKSSLGNVKAGTAARVPAPPSANGILEGLLPNLSQAITAESDAQRQRDLKKIIHCLSDWESIHDQTLIKLITELKNNVDSLDDRMSPLIQQILGGNWPYRSTKIVTEMEDFLSELLVVRPAFCGPAIHSLVSKFITAAVIKVEQDDELSLMEQKVFSIAHRNLQRIFISFPMKQDSAVKTMSHLYPYMGKGVHTHFVYVTNLLDSLEYLNNVKGQLLHVIIHKLVRVDVNIQKKDLEDQTETGSTFTVKKEEGGHEMFQMDLEDEPAKENPLIKTLDVCLDTVFRYFEKTFKSLHETDEGIGDDDNPDNEANIVSLFNSLLSVFQSEILPTFGLNNTQFLYFYVLSLQPSFVTSFLDFLWKNASSVNSPAVIRVQAMSYLSGILARAQFISIKTVKRWLTRMSEWANAYVDKKVKSCHWSSVNLQFHSPFYAVCQTIFYVFAFRNKELIGSRKCVSYTRTLNLGRLVTSDLNPLKACQQQIAVFFVDAAHQHQISYCRTVLERNQRATIPTIAQETMSNLGSQADQFSSTQLEAFFPFDPLLLPRSRKWIDSIYRTYEPYAGEVKVEKDEPADPENDDSIEMELGSYNERKTTVFYCNGSSPFKFKTELKDELDSFID